MQLQVEGRPEQFHYANLGILSDKCVQDIFLDSAWTKVFELCLCAQVLCRNDRPDHVFEPSLQAISVVADQVTATEEGWHKKA